MAGLFGLCFASFDANGGRIHLSLCTVVSLRCGYIRANEQPHAFLFIMSIEFKDVIDTRQLADFLGIDYKNNNIYSFVIAGASNQGISYTEKEYHYAKSIGLPILVYIKKDEVMTADNVDDTQGHLKKLHNFKSDVTKASEVKGFSRRVFAEPALLFETRLFNGLLKIGNYEKG